MCQACRGEACGVTLAARLLATAIIFLSLGLDTLAVAFIGVALLLSEVT